MPKEIQALLAQLKNDPSLRGKIMAAKDIDEFLAVIHSSGFQIDKEDWIGYVDGLPFGLSDEELEDVAGGGEPCVGGGTNCGGGCSWMMSKKPPSTWFDCLFG